MKKFDSITFDPRSCRKELDELKALLDENQELDERKQILPFFRERPNLSVFIGSYFAYISTFDRIAYEYDIFGDFKADLAFGDSTSGWYGFVEFEDGTSSSIFRKKAGKATLEWSPRFERGFSQVVDWFWKLLDMKGTRALGHRFGPEYAGYEGMLIIGRSDHLSQKGKDRLRWRRDHVTVNAKHVHCVTFDNLYQHLDDRLSTYEQAFQADEE
jgi:hypothetical protein